MNSGILVVTGSRDLLGSRSGSSESEAWAKARLREYIDTESPPRFVVQGGAEGPDQWACDLTRPCGTERLSVTFSLDGNIYRPIAIGSGQSTKVRWREEPGPETNPLARNRAMIASVAKAHDNGWRVRVLALIAPWAKTHGTLHTINVAAGAGLEVTRLECPAAYGRATDAVR